MRSVILFVLLSLAAIPSLAQVRPEFASIRLESKEDFNEAADQAALTAATTLLSKNILLTNLSGSDEVVYLIKWMSGTPSYSFTMDKYESNLIESYESAMIIVLSAMVQSAIENKMDGKDILALRKGMSQLLIKYVKDHGIVPKGEFKKLVKADEKGELNDYLSKF